MALTWDTKAVKDSDKIGPSSGDEWHVTETIIFACMYLGIMTIVTDDTAQAFTRRMVAWETTFGVNLRFIKAETERGSGPDAYADRPITLADVRKRIGLRTNASSKSEAAFTKELGQRIMANAAYTVRTQHADSIK